ncbi:MAG: hypothetical protein U1G07_24965 [Verrucomicrobiota bacterium]
MSTEQLTEAVMALPENERLELARRIVASVTGEDESFGRIMDAVPGIEDVVTGKVRGLSEPEFRQALQ